VEKVAKMKIEFIVKSEWTKYVVPPVPTSDMIPDWWRQMPQTQGAMSSHPDWNQSSDVLPSPATVKRCIPFLDTLRSGYIIPMQYDLAVGVDNTTGQPLVQWRNGGWMVPRVEERPWTGFVNENTGVGIPGTENVRHPHGFMFLNPWIIKTPPGYSCLFTSVLNRDLPIQLSSGVVNTDTYVNAVNFPFFIKDNYVGLIKKGSPLMQVIPFKRDEWEMEVRQPTDEDTQNLNHAEGGIQSVMSGGYLANHGCPVRHT